MLARAVGERWYYHKHDTNDDREAVVQEKSEVWVGYLSDVWWASEVRLRTKFDEYPNAIDNGFGEAVALAFEAEADRLEQEARTFTGETS